jgi:hypothetical protein
LADEKHIHIHAISPSIFILPLSHITSSFLSLLLLSLSLSLSTFISSLSLSLFHPCPALSKKPFTISIYLTEGFKVYSKLLYCGIS